MKDENIIMSPKIMYIVNNNIQTKFFIPDKYDINDTFEIYGGGILGSKNWILYNNENCRIMVARRTYGIFSFSLDKNKNIIPGSYNENDFKFSLFGKDGGLQPTHEYDNLKLGAISNDALLLINGIGDFILF